MIADDLITKLKEMKERGAFKNYIDYVRFPFFRTLEPNTIIEFDFPLTVFVGQNGCGKSSTLQALFGCPKGKSVSTYWFNTCIDPIEEFDQSKNRHCLIYSHSSGGPDKEVLKTRINKVGQPDLWDTSEPISRYGMKMGTRNPPVDKDVVYINFRAVQNAFEKRFHEQRPPQSGIQDHLRSRSWYLDRIIKGKTIPHFQGKTHEPLGQLTAGELSAVSKILGRTYKGAKLIKHRIFDHWGYSAILQTEHASYSEAFAGSGETAVVVLVKEIFEAPSNSLLLLDEPENSLHPGAQMKILEFLLEQCIEKQHQIIVCTHAPTLVQALPKQAIKVFTPTAKGYFRVEKEILPQEAFYFLGQPVTDKKRVIVEDRLAKAMIDIVLNRMGEAAKNIFEIIYYPGGESHMKNEAVLYSRDQPSEVFLLFDGDQKPDSPFYNPADLTVGIDSDFDAAIQFLDAEIKKSLGREIKFPSDGNGGVGNKQQQRDLRKNYLKYCRRNIFYLPMKTPEEEIWDDACVENFLNLIFPSDSVLEVKAILAAETNYKKKFVVLTDILCGKSSGEKIDVIHSILTKAWASNKTSMVDATCKILEAIKNKA